MIWDVHREEIEPEEVLARQLARDVVRWCRPEQLDEARVKELTRGVARFCFDAYQRPVFDTDALSAFLCRALWCVGEKRAAMRWMEVRAERVSFRDTALELCRHGDGPALLLNASALGAVRCSTWMSAGNANVWVLDFDRLWREGECLELYLPTTLHPLLMRLSGVWHDSRGQGVLGLRGCAGMARRLARSAGSGSGVRRGMEELRVFCAKTLEKAAQRGHWEALPEVVLLDL